jgi:hypothetical protein
MFADRTRVWLNSLYQTPRTSEQTVLLQNLRSVFLGDEHGRQGDDGLQLFALQQLDRLPQALGAGGGVEEGGGELALADPGDAFSAVVMML